jgi:hypothetical protein
MWNQERDQPQPAYSSSGVVTNHWRKRHRLRRFPLVENNRMAESAGTDRLTAETYDRRRGN